MEHFTILELQNSSIDGLNPLQKHRSTDFEARKLLNGFIILYYLSLLCFLP